MKKHQTKSKPSQIRKDVDRWRQWQSLGNGGKVRQFDTPGQERKFSKIRLKQGIVE